MILLAGLLLPLSCLSKPDAGQVRFPEAFDSLGPTVQTLEREGGRLVHFIDDGEAGWLPVVLTGGLGTSVRVIRLLDFLRSLRRTLNIRIITVERNGFGQTALDPSLTMGDFADDVEAVLDHLGIERFAVFGISGGGPYTSKIASRNAERLLSVHMAATAPSLGQPDRCGDESPASGYRDMLRQPMVFFGFPADSPLHQVEGFQDTAFDEAARAHFVRGQMADVAPLDHELSLYCDEGVIDTTKVTAPVFVYYGLADSVLAVEDLDIWPEAFPAADVTIRRYPGEGHDVQYRHLDQILLDVAGYGDRLLVCEDNESKLVSQREAEKEGSQLGLCAWSGE
jgi:pimeloyl-ACP methyl ester carboxylesterase